MLHAIHRTAQGRRKGSVLHHVSVKFSRGREYAGTGSKNEGAQLTEKGNILHRLAVKQVSDFFVERIYNCM